METIIPNPSQVVNTLTKSLPTPLETVNTILSESLPNPIEEVNTLLTECLPNPIEVNTTLESLSNSSEVINIILLESLPNPIEVNTILESLSNSSEVVNTILESLPNPEEVVNTLLLESLPLKVNTSFFKSTFKRPQIRIQLPTFTNTCLSDVVLSPTEMIEPKTKEKEKEKKVDQDKSQKLAVLATLVLELYRMLTSSLLLLFVPQSCKGQLCSISDNLNWNPNHHQYNFGVCVNFITLFTYTCLYYTELKRENRLIKYLDVNPNMPSSNEAVENTLQHIDLEKKRKILAIDKYYQRISYISIGMYVFNSIVSGVIIRRFYFGTQTTTSFITSLLFMFTKLLNVYQVSNTEEHIFYSGYMKTFVQFNDLDKTHKNPDNL